MINLMNEELAENILHWLQYDDAEIIAVYEYSFKAIRKNVYNLIELNVELNYHDKRITEDNVYTCVDYVVHVLERY